MNYTVKYLYYERQLPAILSISGDTRAWTVRENGTVGIESEKNLGSALARLKSGTREPTWQLVAKERAHREKDTSAKLLREKSSEISTHCFHSHLSRPGHEFLVNSHAYGR